MAIIVTYARADDRRRGLPRDSSARRHATAARALGWLVPTVLFERLRNYDYHYFDRDCARRRDRGRGLRVIEMPAGALRWLEQPRARTNVGRLPYRALDDSRRCFAPPEYRAAAALRPSYEPHRRRLRLRSPPRRSRDDDRSDGIASPSLAGLCFASLGHLRRGRSSLVAELEVAARTYHRIRLSSTACERASSRSPPTSPRPRT